MSDANFPSSQLRSVLRRIEHAASDIAKALAEKHAEEARRFVRVKSGALKATVRVEEGEHEGEWLTAAGNKQVDYAIFEEMGTHKSSGSHFFSTGREMAAHEHERIIKRHNPFK